MDFFDIVRRRRSVRKFTNERIPDEVITKALKSALLAANSSNLQPWEFYWVKSKKNRNNLIKLAKCSKTAEPMSLYEFYLGEIVNNLENYKENG